MKCFIEMSSLGTEIKIRRFPTNGLFASFGIFLEEFLRTSATTSAISSPKKPVASCAKTSQQGSFNLKHLSRQLPMSVISTQLVCSSSYSFNWNKPFHMCQHSLGGLRHCPHSSPKRLRQLADHTVRFPGSHATDFNGATFTSKDVIATCDNAPGW